MSRPDTSYRSVLRLSTPVMLSQLSYTAMGIIDTIMVGRVGVIALASVGLGSILFWWLVSLFSVLVFILWPLTPQLMAWTGASAEVQESAGRPAIWAGRRVERPHPLPRRDGPPHRDPLPGHGLAEAGPGESGCGGSDDGRKGVHVWVEGVGSRRPTCGRALRNLRMRRAADLPCLMGSVPRARRARVSAPRSRVARSPRAPAGKRTWSTQRTRPRSSRTSRSFTRWQASRPWPW